MSWRTVVILWLLILSFLLTKWDWLQWAGIGAVAMSFVLDIAKAVREVSNETDSTG